MTNSRPEIRGVDVFELFILLFRYVVELSKFSNQINRSCYFCVEMFVGSDIVYVNKVVIDIEYHKFCNYLLRFLLPYRDSRLLGTLVSAF